MNWDTLKFRTRKLLVIVISKTFRRFSPILILQTLSSLNDIKCCFNDIEIMGKEIQMEINEKNNNEFELLKVFQIVKSNQEIDEIGNKNIDEDKDKDNDENKKYNINYNDNKNTEKNPQNDINENLQENISLSPKKRKLPLFSAFTKIDLFELISNFVVEGQFNNWEIISILTYVTNLGTTLHITKRLNKHILRFMFYVLCFQSFIF